MKLSKIIFGLLGYNHSNKMASDAYQAALRMEAQHELMVEALEQIHCLPSSREDEAHCIAKSALITIMGEAA